ncbi:MAG: response regulator [Myxococcaceae bacterium]|nr:response regulator [Myxococcaceae bacterium]
MSFSLDGARLPLAAFQTDARGQLTATNDAFGLLLGLAPGASVPGDTLEKAVGRAALDEWLAAPQVLKLKLGSPTRSVEVHASPLAGGGVEGVVLDRTRERDLEQQATLLDRMPFGVLVVQDGAVVHANSRQERVLPSLGKNAEALIRGSVHPEDRDVVIQRLKARLAGEAAPTNYTFRQPLGGVEHTFELWAERVEYQGRPAVQALIFDVSDRVKAERELALLDKKYQHAQKLEAIGRLAGGIAHDFNNLLTVISSAVDLARRRASNDPRDDLDLIADAAQRAGEMTRQLLAFSRQDPGVTRTLDLNHVVARLERMLRRLVGENIELKLTVPDRPLWVKANEAHLEQVLANLTVNACDAMPRGGRLEISTSQSDRSEGVGQLAKLTVLDTGVGIAPEVLPRLFEPFFTTKPVGKGTGLGLSSVRGYVEQAGGFVEIESTPGVGTAVYVYLPVAEEPVVRSPPKPATSRPRPPKRVLVVEDEALVRSVVKRVLARAGHTVTAVESAQEALARAGSEAFDLVLTDVVMPLMGGVELSQRLAAAHPALPVVFMTGYLDDRALPAGLTALPGPTLHKPFSPDSLLDAVDSATRGPVTTG